MVAATEKQLLCAGCQQAIDQEHPQITCPRCQLPYHRACWEEGGCRTDGCEGAESTLSEILHAEVPPQAGPESVLANPFIPWLIGGAIAVILALTAIIALVQGVPPKTVLIIGVVMAALTFDYVNGMHDAGNAIATVISTRVLTPITALIMAAVLNLLGAMIHAGVAASIATKFANVQPHDPHQITLVMILCGLIGASVWSYLTASWGLPVSTSHSLFGGLIGVFLIGHVPLNMKYLGQIGMWMVLAPVLAFSAGWLLMVALMWMFRHVTPHKINTHFRILQIFSSAMMAFSHGSNDAQKAMGIITMALVSGGFITSQAGGVEVPLWVKASCALVIALGTGYGGMRVIQTLGHKIIKLAPVHGFAAETVAAATIQLVTFLKIPISTTHVISSSILGIGASKRLSAVRWGVAANIVVAWVFTIPTCAMAGALLYALVRLCGAH